MGWWLCLSILLKKPRSVVKRPLNPEHVETYSYGIFRISMQSSKFMMDSLWPHDGLLDFALIAKAGVCFAELLGTFPLSTSAWIVRCYFLQAERQVQDK